MFINAPPENRPDVKAAIAYVGFDARPTGRLRILQTKQSGRLQQEWRGEFGVAWLDVPIVEVPELPPRWLEAMPPPDGPPSGEASGPPR
jgi:hypothetical protein